MNDIERLTHEQAALVNARIGGCPCGVAPWRLAVETGIDQRIIVDSAVEWRERSVLDGPGQNYVLRVVGVREEAGR